MKKDYRILIAHILECIDKVEEYTKDITKEKFLDATQIQDAVMRGMKF